MGNTAVSGYTDIFGKHGAWIGDHTGPKSYSTWSAPNTGGDVVAATNFGLRSIDGLFAMGISESGTYYVMAKLSSTQGASVNTAILVWIVAATGNQATGDLSGETVRLLVIGG